MKRRWLVISAAFVIIASAAIWGTNALVANAGPTTNPVTGVGSDFTPALPGDENVKAVNKAVEEGRIEFARPK
ncbi:hypothetical protein ACFFK0_24140 [Paenibacillus chartarius]|uniref:DUF4148 domain-containing protein n=1 Tax=Paenibacillus chartarius TaxID=747481 RepID=A0ABV6DS59_9BACL